MTWTVVGAEVGLDVWETDGAAVDTSFFQSVEVLSSGAVAVS